MTSDLEAIQKARYDADESWVTDREQGQPRVSDFPWSPNVKARWAHAFLRSLNEQGWFLVRTEDIARWEDEGGR